MIAFIHGTVIEKEPMRAVLEAGGVGYELLIPLSTYERLPREGDEAKLLAYHCVREDDEALYGFATSAERELFAKLTSVSGVGPKIALAILSGSSVSELSLAIASGDARRLSAIKGVGKKTAEKICVELKDRVAALALGGAAASAGKKGIVADSVAALRALGFNEEASSKMVTEVLARDPEISSTEDVIRRALASR